MYKHILVATDGSALSRNAVRKAVRLAKALGARVTGFHATPPHEFTFYGEYVPPDFIPPREYRERVKKAVDRCLGEVSKAAAAAGVRARCAHSAGANPYQEIIKAARGNGCDLIVMASHGRRGISRLLLGSETSKVLLHSRIPVLVIK